MLRPSAPPASPTPEQLQREKAERLRQVAASMQADLDKLLREEQAEWLAETGRPMPMNARDLMIEARLVMPREEVRQAEERAETTAGERFGYEEVKVEATIAKRAADREDARRIAVGVEVAKQSAAISGPGIADMTDTDETKSSSVEYNVDALLQETIAKTAKREFDGDKEKAVHKLQRLGWEDLAEAIANATKAPHPDPKTLSRHYTKGKSCLLRRWAPFRPTRGGKSAAKRDSSAAVDIAGAAGQLATVQRPGQVMKQRPDLSQDPRTDEERQRDEAEARWFEQGKPGTCSSCGDPAARYRNGRPWCDDCYAEKFEGETPDVIGNRPR